MTSPILSATLIIACFSLARLFAQAEGVIAHPELLPIAAASFRMGSETGGEDEKPVHTVALKAYAIGKTEVTVHQYKAFCQETGRKMPVAPAWGWVDSYAMTRVTWDDAVAYCVWLTTKTGKTFRLPTEAEWEYAARGAAYDQLYAGGNAPDALAWYAENSSKRIQTVGRKQANINGLYDMSGNAAEWCSDWYDEAWYANSLENNPKGPDDGYQKVVRGGSADYNADFMRCTFRNRANPENGNDFIGFRVVAEVP